MKRFEGGFEEERPSASAAEQVDDDTLERLRDKVADRRSLAGILDASTIPAPNRTSRRYLIRMAIGPMVDGEHERICVMEADPDQQIGGVISAKFYIPIIAFGNEVLANTSHFAVSTNDAAGLRDKFIVDDDGLHVGILVDGQLVVDASKTPRLDLDDVFKIADQYGMTDQRNRDLVQDRCA